MNPQRSLLLLLPVVFLLLAPACGDDEGALALLEEVRADEYRDWTRAPGYDARTTSAAPHGGAVEIFINPTVEDALAATPPPGAWPVGSVIVKDGYRPSGVQVQTSIMEKRGDGWFWAEFDGDDEVQYSGEPDLCLDCHRSGADYVRAFGFEGR